MPVLARRAWLLHLLQRRVSQLLWTFPFSLYLSLRCVFSDRLTRFGGCIRPIAVDLFTLLASCCLHFRLLNSPGQLLGGA